MGSRLEEKSKLVRKRIEGHEFNNEEGEEYEGSKFGGFPEYFRRKKIKLQNLDAQLRSQSVDKPQIFKGVVCHVNGYTQPSLNDLHLMIVQHGGGFIQYLDGKTMVTHIIASNLTLKKKEEFRRYRIVKPAWIVDSVDAGKLLPWNSYRLLDEGVGQKVLGFENGNIVSQANQKTLGYREQTNTSWHTSQLKVSNFPAHQQPGPTQTMTPLCEDIEDDLFPMPEISGSMEAALNEADHIQTAQPPREVDDTDDNAPHAATKIQTPPTTSPPPPPELHTSVDASHSNHVSNIHPYIELAGDLQPREGSQEPDIWHSVIRQSEVFKDISPARLAEMTAEEHNALLLSDPNIRKSTVVHPDFLDQYYRESRLHHLSTWKADLKSQLQVLAAEKSSTQKAKQKRLPGQRRYVMHVDFDSFFATVSLKKYPQYAEKPAVVAHGMGSGSEIASCNYPARKFGITNGMWMKRAQQLCADVKILPYDFPGYEAASRQFYDVVLETGGIVQSVSIDEALVDISAMCFTEAGTDGIKRHEGGVYREQEKANQIAQKLRDEVFKNTGCAVSVGIGGNILQAKVALRKAKPAGQYQLKPEEVLDFIGQLEVTKLPGVAWSTGGKLEEIGIKLVKDIRETTKEKLINTLGPKTGEKLWQYARGIDKIEVGEQVVRKSVSAEVNWGVRFETPAQVDEFMHGLCGELNKRLLKERVKGKQLTIKVMRRAADAPRDPPKHLGHGKCDVFNKSTRLGIATNEANLLAKEAIAMLRSFGISPGELRGIGVQMQQLEPLKQGADGLDQASQRRLQFRKPNNASVNMAVSAATEAPAQDDAHTPRKDIIAEKNLPSAAFKPLALGTPTKKPLNTLGTQFFLPSQVDASVLAELPDDIRAKLGKHVVDRPVEDKSSDASQESGPDVFPNSHSPIVSLHSHSQIDPSILEALPEDVREEVLGFYESPGYRAEKRGGQAFLPQSPRKFQALPPSSPVPIKQARGRPRGSRNRATGVGRNSARAESSTLTQSNFVSRPDVQDEGSGTDTESEIDELDPHVLAALPDDLRQEVLAQQRQTRLQRAGGIDLSLHQRPRATRKKKAEDEGPLDRYFVLPPRIVKPTFTSRQLSELPELRSAVSAWFREFNDEGPYDEDISALVKYLKDVVLQEHDLNKAVAVVRWMAWVIDESEGVPEDVVHAWYQALGKAQTGVRDAANERGMRNINFG